MYQNNDGMEESDLDFLDFIDDADKTPINCQGKRTLFVSDGRIPFRLSHCESLEEIRFSASADGIQPEDLLDCIRLRRIEVHPDNPRYASCDGVLYNKNMTRLLYLPPNAGEHYVFPETVVSIGRLACRSYQGSSFRIPGRVRSIGEAAFAGCKNLEQVTLEEGVQVIESSAFQNCGLESISFPASLEEIGSFAFSECTHLRHIRFSQGLRRIRNYAFRQCAQLETFLPLPDTVEELGESIFAECPYFISVWTVSLPRSLKKMSPLAMSGSGEEYTISEENPVFRTENGILLSKNGDTLIRFPISRKATYLIPPQLRHIGPDAFLWSSLETLYIPPTVESVGAGAFWGSHLRSVAFSAGLREIACCAFGDCAQLRQVLLPETVEVIQDHAFALCPSLKTVTVPESCREIESGAFSACAALQQVHLPGGEVRLARDAFSDSPGVWFPIPPKVFPSIRTRNRSVVQFCRRFSSGEASPKEIGLYTAYIRTNRKKLEKLAAKNEPVRDFISRLTGEDS